MNGQDEKEATDDRSTRISPNFNGDLAALTETGLGVAFRLNFGKTNHRSRRSTML